MRRFTPRAASPAIGNYSAEFATAETRRSRQNPDLAQDLTEDLTHDLVAYVELDALRRGLAVPVQRLQILGARFDGVRQPYP